MILKFEFLRYVISGLIINGLGFIFFIVLLEYFNFSPLMSVFIQYPFVICIYYLSQTYYVFKKNINANNLVQFILNFCFLYSLNIIALFTCTEILNFNAIISQFFILVFLILINFVIQKKIIYK